MPGISHWKLLLTWGILSRISAWVISIILGYMWWLTLHLKLVTKLAKTTLSFHAPLRHKMLERRPAAVWMPIPWHSKALHYFICLYLFACPNDSLFCDLSSKSWSNTQLKICLPPKSSSRLLDLQTNPLDVKLSLDISHRLVLELHLLPESFLKSIAAFRRPKLIRTSTRLWVYTRITVVKVRIALFANNSVKRDLAWDVFPWACIGEFWFHALWSFPPPTISTANNSAINARDR